MNTQLVGNLRHSGQDETSQERIVFIVLLLLGFKMLIGVNHLLFNQLNLSVKIFLEE